MARSPRYVKSLQNKAAQEVCWRVIIAMALGELECIPVKDRKWLAEPMQEWSDLAAELGELKSENAAE